MLPFIYLECPVVLASSAKSSLDFISNADSTFISYQPVGIGKSAIDLIIGFIGLVGKTICLLVELLEVGLGWNNYAAY